MRVRYVTAGCAILLALVCATPASAQSEPPISGITTTIPELTMAQTIIQLVRPVGAPRVGEALGLATQLEIGTALFGAAPGGFTYKFDRTQGRPVRTASTFGPAFAESALTSGEGSVSGGVSFMSSSFDRLDSRRFDGIQLRSVTASQPRDGRVGVANLALSAKTVVISGRMGVTDKFDIGVAIPMVTIKASGTTSLSNGSGQMILFGQGINTASGLGDVAGIAKYRLKSFGTELPDPGGLAVMATVRFPTGDKANLRGLGVTRTLLSFIASSVHRPSSGQKEFRPHVNVGFEWWSKGVGAVSDYAPNASVSARHQVQYAAGFEFEAAPKVTLLVDFVGREILGGGRIGFIPDASPAVGVSASESAMALPEGIRKLQLAPGLKVNLKGKLLLSLNALIALKDRGLHARVSPMAGIDLSF
jgi:hypothetical protein